MNRIDQPARDGKVEEIHEMLLFNSAFTWMIVQQYFSVTMDTLHNCCMNLEI